MTVPYDPLVQGERRACPPPAPGHSTDLSDIWDLLRAIDKKVDLHLADEAEFRPRLVELVGIMEKSKGAITLIKWCAYLGAPIYALILWFKDHVKL